MRMLCGAHNCCCMLCSDRQQLRTLLQRGESIQFVRSRSVCEYSSKNLRKAKLNFNESVKVPPVHKVEFYRRSLGLNVIFSMFFRFW